MEDVAGWITFRTQIDDKYFEKGIKKAEKDLEKLDNETKKLSEQKEEIDIKVNFDREQLDKDYKQQLKNLEKDYKDALKLNPAGLSSGLERSFDIQREQIDTEYTRKLDEIYSSYDKLERKIKKNNEAKEEEKQRLEELIEKYEEWKDQNKGKDINFGEAFADDVKDAGNQMERVIKKVAKWGVMLFGIRGVYSLISRSMHSISQSNKGVAADIEYMRWALAKSLEPVVVRIVGWAMKLMQSINYLIYKITGFKIFGEATAKNFKSANKSAKELSKTLAGFDEMNILGDNTGTSGGTVLPTSDLNDFNNLSQTAKERIEAIADKLEPLYTFLKEKVWPIVEKILKYINDMSTEEFITWLTTIGIIIGGFKLVELVEGSKLLTSAVLLLQKGLQGLVTGGLAKLSPLLTKAGTGITSLLTKIGGGSALTGGLIGALVILDAILITKIIVDIKDKLIPAIKETNKQIDDTIDLINEVNGQTKKANEKVLEFADGVDAENDALKNNVDLMIDNIEHNGKAIEKEKELISVTGALTGENKVHKEMIKSLDDEMWTNINTLGELANKKKLTKDAAQKFVDSCQDEIEKLEKQNSTLSENSEEYKKNKEKIELLKKQIDITKGNYQVKVNTSAEKKPIDDMQKAVDKLDGEYKVEMSADTKKANKKVSEWLKNLDTAGILGNFLKAGYSLGSALKLFKYAKGGIVNLPGKGIPLSVGGEAGREGVIPLTDEEQMQILGESIGRYVTINLTNINKLDSREISRTSEKVQSNRDFIRNR